MNTHRASFLHRPVTVDQLSAAKRCASGLTEECQESRVVFMVAKELLDAAREAVPPFAHIHIGR